MAADFVCVCMSPCRHVSVAHTRCYICKRLFRDQKPAYPQTYLISEGQLTIAAKPETAGQMDLVLCPVNTVRSHCVLLGI